VENGFQIPRNTDENLQDQRDGDAFALAEQLMNESREAEHELNERGNAEYCLMKLSSGMFWMIFIVPFEGSSNDYVNLDMPKILKATLLCLVTN